MGLLGEQWIRRYRAVREATEALSAPLSAEDQQVQSMPWCSPTKWHRAHTTWFFETFLLAPRGVGPLHPGWDYLYNSYYDAIGPRHTRAQRGLVSRPSVTEIGAYRRAVDERVEALVRGLDDAAFDALSPVPELGLAHEEQHQELLLTDILHALSVNPLRPAYRAEAVPTELPAAPRAFRAFDGGLRDIGALAGFHFDNEGPRHRVWLGPFALADRLVTVGEWRAFAADHGYETPSLWLGEGFDWARAEGVGAPMHLAAVDGVVRVFGLEGEREAEDDEPVVHLSYYEADAIARYLGARLPTEAEWEVGASDGGLAQLYTHAWQWTSSAYSPYPGYRTEPGALGEYNGKFMVNQQVLRGGSRFTPEGHTRPSYRNFWPAPTRFQVAGVRLAREG